MMRDVKSDQADAELARLAAKGDASAFEEIHRRYRRLVYAIALRMTRNAADAEDLTQESFVSVLRYIGSFRGEASFSTWLYRLTTNQVKMHFRRRSRRPEGLTSDAKTPESDAGAGRYVSNDAVLDRIGIENALCMLPPGYRAAFILHDVEGFEHEEVARILGCAVGTSKSQLHKARTKLRKLLAAR